MHVGVVHNTKSGSLSVSRISIEYDPATGKQIEQVTEDEYVAVDIYPEAINGRLENIAIGKYDDCPAAVMVTRVILKNPTYENLGVLYKDGDLLCLKHHSDSGDHIDELSHGDELDPGFMGGLLGNLHDLKQFD